MVYWKGEIPDNAGSKAVMLDSVDSFDVPNFFVIGRDEVEEIVGESETTGDILDSEIPEDVQEDIQDSYEEIGMSSEVRGASDQARELVGGQRDTQRVSVRISGGGKGVNESRLDVGPSSLIDAIKAVVASYYRAGNDGDHPAVIVQKMVEPDYSGAALLDYLGGKNFLEAVEGLGTSLEEGITAPEVYIDTDKVKCRIPQSQVKVSRNPMDGGYRRRRIQKSGRSFEDSEIREFFEKLEQEEVNVKFVYKRGSFYIVDAFPADPGEENGKISLEGIRVSGGPIQGRVGKEVSFEEEPLLPENYREALISTKGGYSSTAAQLARQAEKPAIFSFSGDLPKGQEVSIGPGSVSIDAEEVETENIGDTNDVTASEVVPLNRDGGLHLSPPFREGYAVTDRRIPGTKIPESGYLTSYSDVFSFEGDRAVLDTRYIEPEGLKGALDYLDADLKVLVVERIDSGMIRKAIENGFTVFAADSNLDRLRDTVAKEEKRFVLERLRE